MEPDLRKVTYKYYIGQLVRINEINVLGRVDALQTDIDGNMYSVVYWNDGIRNRVWLYDWEVGAA